MIEKDFDILHGKAEIEECYIALKLIPLTKKQNNAIRWSNIKDAVITIIQYAGLIMCLEASFYFFIRMIGDL